MPTHQEWESKWTSNYVENLSWCPYSWCIQGCQKFLRSAGANRMKEVLCHVLLYYCLFFGNISRLKILGHCCPNRQRLAGAVTPSDPGVLTLLPWKRLSSSQYLFTTHQRAYGRAHAGISHPGRNGFGLNFTPLEWQICFSFFHSSPWIQALKFMTLFYHGCLLVVLRCPGSAR